MIKTKIAQILGPTRFVLAAGNEQGVEEGMEFIIYKLTEPIFDPETKEPLGQLELHKGRVKVIHVQEKLSTAITLMRRRYSPPLFGPKEAAINELGRWFDEREELPIDQSAVATATKVDLTVKIGDLVRSVS
jgi:hypothetical protein